MNSPRRPLPRTQPSLELVCLANDAQSVQQACDLVSRLRLLGFDCPNPAFVEPPASPNTPPSIRIVVWPQSSAVTPEACRLHLEQNAPSRTILMAEAPQVQRLGPGLLNQVDACLSPGASARQMLQALQVVQLSGCYFTPDIKQGLLGLMSDGVAAQETEAAQASSELALTSLTPREQQIWDLVAAGLTTKAIAEQLQISAHTVDAYRRNLRQKIAA